MPLFLNAEPASTGTSLSAMVERRIGGAHLFRRQFMLGEILGQNGVIMLGNVLDYFFAMFFVELLG